MSFILQKILNGLFGQTNSTPFSYYCKIFSLLNNMKNMSEQKKEYWKKVDDKGRELMFIEHLIGK